MGREGGFYFLHFIGSVRLSYSANRCRKVAGKHREFFVINIASRGGVHEQRRRGWELNSFVIDQSPKCCDVRHGLFNSLCLLCFVFSFISLFVLCMFILFLISTSRHNTTNFLSHTQQQQQQQPSPPHNSTEIPPKTRKM
jgi:hypothetical protein